MESRILSCATDLPNARIAFDDFIIDPDDLDQGENFVRIRRVVWWGVLVDNESVADPPPFRIAFYANNAADCTPAALLFEECPVEASKVFVGIDCQGFAVYKFSAKIGSPGHMFDASPATRYWLSIAESDEDDGAQLKQDFRWSGHRPPVNCLALQKDAAGVVHRPLTSACYEKVMDLAFGLHAKSIAGGGDPSLGGQVAMCRLADGSTLVESLPVQFDDMGRFVVFPEAPNGTYVAILNIPGTFAIKKTITLQSGQEAMFNIDPIQDVFWGDLDADGTIGQGDLADLLSNYGAVAP